jgi:hypothetical protein
MQSQCETLHCDNKVNSQLGRVRRVGSWCQAVGNAWVVQVRVGIRPGGLIDSTLGWRERIGAVVEPKDEANLIKQSSFGGRHVTNS